MNFTRASLLFLLATVSLSQLAAKEYAINTGNETVTCTLNTLTQEKMISLIGAFDAFYVATNTATTNYTTGGFFLSGSQTHVATTELRTKVDPFHDAVKNYMAVEVIIKNNSTEPFYLSKDEYLEGIENVIVSKNEMIRILYPELNKDFAQKYIGCVLCAVFTGIATAGLGAAGWANWYEYDRMIPAFFISTAVLFGLGSMVCIYGATAMNNNLFLSNEKERAVINSTFFKKFKKQFNQFYSPEDSDYEIPAKSEFHDLFFIDLGKVERDFFSIAANKPKLVMQTEK